MQNVEVTLEFAKIKEQIQEYAKTELGKEYVDSLSFSSDKELVASQLNVLKEMMDLVSRYGQLPLQSSVHILKLIEIAKKTALLTPQDLNYIANDIEQSIKLGQHLKKIEDEFPAVKAIVENFSDLTSLQKEIKRIVTPSLTISDHASPELKEIRDKIKTLESTLNSKVASIAYHYASYLNDSNVTIRDGHFVLPVKTAYKNKVLGIIYDISDSGNTTFIEPLELVQINNDIASKKIEESEEIRKILKKITALVLLQEVEVIKNNEIIAQLDFLNAKANYALENEMNVAKLSDASKVVLIEARHPLIDRKKVVANDYFLNEEKRIVVISGPNAGGKTVSIKTVGLLVYMNQSGLAIPASESELGIFKNIYLDIGDNQSLSDNLSTFSAHMKNIGEILDVVKAKDLVLLDELGTGTDPIEGELIALGIVKYLERKHPLAMISSHYSKIKEYAFISENIENSSMLFDEENLRPTYRYKYAVPGKSYGLEVAKRYGIKDEIISEAKKELEDQSNNRFENLLKILQSNVEQNERLKDELEKEKANLEAERKALDIAKDRLQKQKDHLLEDVKREKEQIIEETKKEIDEIIKMLSKEDIKLHEVVELKKKVENLEDDIESIIYDEEVAVDDYASIPSMNLEGKIIRIKGQKATLLTLDGLSIEVEKNKLHKIEPPKASTKRMSASHYEDKINTSLGLELNIIGMHRDEALDALKKYIDACIVKNIKQVRIIHGFGSGVLRKMVHDYLSTLKGVKYRLGDIHEGGGGATVVILHD